MDRNNRKKADQLGMPQGTASNKLRKNLLFRFTQELGRDTCFQCGEKIEEVENFSIEHIVPYLDSDDPVGLFFDLENIAFSHLKCNIGAGRKIGPWASHGTASKYRSGCRCLPCKKAATEDRRKYPRKKVR